MGSQSTHKAGRYLGRGDLARARAYFRACFVLHHATSLASPPFVWPENGLQESAHRYRQMATRRSTSCGWAARKPPSVASGGAWRSAVAGAHDLADPRGLRRQGEQAKSRGPVGQRREGGLR